MQKTSVSVKSTSYWAEILDQSQNNTDIDPVHLEALKELVRLRTDIDNLRDYWVRTAHINSLGDPVNETRAKAFELDMAIKGIDLQS